MQTAPRLKLPDLPFVTGAKGYIGSAFLRLAVAQDLNVKALARSETSDARIHGAGAKPVMGELCDCSADWTTKARLADAVVHLAQPQTFGGRVTNRRARRYFVVDNEPTTSERIARLAAHSLGVPPKGRRVPEFVLRLLAGRVIAESLATECRNRFVVTSVT